MGVAKKKGRPRGSKNKKKVEIQEPIKEPEYSYIKGKGWVPALEHKETAWEQIGRVKVILTERTPEIGENYFAESAETFDPEKKALTPVQRLLCDLRDEYWTRLLNNEDITIIKSNHIPIWHARSAKWEIGNKVFVVDLEII